MTSPTGAKSLKATCTPKSCEDNCWELTHQTMTRIAMMPDSYEYFKTVHGFSKTPTPFSDLKKALKNFADSQKLKD